MTGYEDGHFKAYAPIVVRAFNEMDNYLIFEEEKSTGYCCVYFSSNGIYAPSDEQTFEREIIKKNKFEFFGTRIKHCSKHIFVRDIHKQWYLHGINKKYDSIEKVADFLKRETEGYKVVTIGSSAGGFASALFATLIHAEYAICIDAQFSLYDEIIFGSLERNPFVDEMKDKTTSRYYRLNDILGEVPVYYFYSAFSPFDQRSMASVQGNKAIRFIPFKSAEHGSPFSPLLYEHILDMPPKRLERLTGKTHHPKLFLLRYAFYPKVIRRMLKRLSILK